MKHCYFNGKITPLTKTMIDPRDIGILRGYGIFDFMTTVNGVPFLFDAHYKRTVQSAKTLGMEFPVRKDEYYDIIQKLLVKNKCVNRRVVVRTVLTGGVSPDMLSIADTPTFYIFLHELSLIQPKPEVYQKGVKVITHEFTRSFPEIKTSNYITSVKNNKMKNRKGAFEMLYVQKGKVLECTTSNIFVIKKRTIITPKDDVLCGTTRNFVVRLARKHGFTVKEESITLKKFLAADEIFLTAAGKDILPIVKCDSTRIGTGKPGPVTQELMQYYDAYVEQYS